MSSSATCSPKPPPELLSTIVTGTDFTVIYTVCDSSGARWKSWMSKDAAPSGDIDTW
jgi:hypothetical protein